jgi:hypothetical protein
MFCQRITLKTRKGENWIIINGSEALLGSYCGDGWFTFYRMKSLNYYYSSAAQFWHRLLLPAVLVVCTVFLVSCASNGKHHCQTSDNESSSPLPHLSVAIPVDEANVRVIVLDSIIKRTTNVAIHLKDNLSVIIDGSRQQNAYKTYLINAAYQISQVGLPSKNVVVATNYYQSATNVLRKDAWPIDFRQFKYYENRDEFVFGSTRIYFDRPSEHKSEFEKSGNVTDWPRIYARPGVQKAIEEYFGKIAY